MSEQYGDLGITQSQDGDYWDIVIPDLDFETDYALQAGWIYTDKAKGTSELSDRFNFTTLAQEGLLSPRFISTDLYAEGSILYISWNGQDSGGNYYLDSILKQVNVWIKGGDFGDEYVKFGTFGNKAGTITVNATKISTYCVKLQAESKLDKFSAFSSEFCVTMLKQPKSVYDVRHTWDVSGNLSLFWKFDPTLKDATNDNTMADSFGLQMLDEENDVDATWWTAVEKDKIPPLEQKIIISASQLQKVFGQFTAFEIDYASFIYVRDKNLQTSFVTGYSLAKYTDPLTAPAISAVKAPMAYNVSYTANSAFDKIYVEESIDSGVTWSSTPFVTSSNPAYIATTNSLARLVRARFSKKLGGFTGYSNIVTVTPDKIDPTDTTAPTNPTNVSATASVDANDKTGFSLQATISFTKSSDADCRGYRVRWTTQTSNPIYEYGYVDHPATGNTVSFTVSGLIPNTTYYYQVASVDQFNNTQSYTAAGTFIAQDSVATAEGSLARLKSYISIGGATGDQFKFGTGILDSINTSITTTPAFTAAPATGYHGILLNKTGNKNNYWLTTGQLRVGTDTQYMYFDGANLYLTGDINARSGKISGNVTISSGGSFIAGTAGQPRVQMNSTGIFAYGNTLVEGVTVLTETTQILVDATTDAPTFITTRAKIGNWIVGTDSLSAGGITLSSSTPLITATNSGSYVGIRPRQSSGTDIVLWSGNTASPAINSAASGQAGFQVNANGQLYATGAIISGKITVESGSSLGGLLNDTSKVYYSATTPTAPTGGFKSGDGWVDTANNNQLKIWNGTAWVVAQDSEAVRSIANLKTKTTYGPTQPTNSILGDVWFDTTAGINYFKVYNGTQWVRMKDSDITAAAQSAADALTEANKKSTTTSSATAPSSPKSGDIWFDTTFNYFKVWSTTVTPAAWVRLKDGDLTQAQTDIIAANTKATNALAKAALFGVDGSLVSNMIIENSGAAIYSKYNSGGVIAKDSYSSTSAGFYLGWDNQAGVLYPAFNIGNANAYMKWSNYDQTLRIKGNISLNAGSDLDGTALTDVKAGATAGSSALQPGGNLTGSVGGTPVATIKSGATAGSTAAQPGNGVTLKNDGSKMINQIDLLASGIKISSATSGTRVEMSNSGLYLYKGTSTTPTVALDAATGDAQFSGTVNASGGTFSGNISASGTITGGTISGATVTAGSITGSTITGGTIQTGGTSATRRIVISGSQPDRIDFYPKTGDDADVPGYLWVSDDAGSVTLPGLVIVPPTKSTWSTPPKIKMTQTGGAGGFLDLSAVQISLTGTVRINTYAYHVGNVAVATNAHRNISAGTTAPSGGNTGDVYIQY
jgi:hypothetical protein